MRQKKEALAPKKYLLLHMGGTIGMVPGKKGKLRPPENATEYENSVSSVLKKFVQYHKNIDFDFLCLSTADSNDLNPEAMEELAAVIHALQKDYDGILITHGTDTMATTAAALNLAFQTPGGASHLFTPIVITGAQNTIHTMPSDAIANLLFGANSLMSLSGHDYFPGVFVAFGGLLIDGAHVLKTSESAYDAFHPTITSALLGKADSHDEFGIVFENLFQDQGISHKIRQQRLLDVTGPLPCGQFLVSTLKGIEGCSTDAFIHTIDPATFGSPRSYMPQSRDLYCLAMLFRLTGIGNTGRRNYEPLAEIVENTGIPLFGALDIPGGKQDMAAYEAGSEAHECGLLPSRATIDAALVQLQWSLAQQHINLPRLVKTMSFYNSIVGMGRSEANREVGTQSDPNTTLQLPTIYNQLPKHANAFAHRLASSQEIIGKYRTYKGTSFRYLDVPEYIAKYAGNFLPQGRGDIKLTEIDATDLKRKTGWTPPQQG